MRKIKSKRQNPNLSLKIEKVVTKTLKIVCEHCGVERVKVRPEDEQSLDAREK